MPLESSGLFILQKFLGSLPVPILMSPSFSIRTKDSLRSFDRERGYQTGDRSPPIGDQDLHARFDLVQVFAEAGFEFGYGSCFHNFFLFYDHYSLFILTCQSYFRSRSISMIGGGLLAGKSQSETSVFSADTSAQADLWVVRALSTD